MPETICSERRKTSPLLILIIFLIATVARLFFPVVMNDSMGFYSAASWAVIEHQNWGKQVLAGVLEYSPLPSSLMITLSPLSFFSALNIAAVALAISQAAVLSGLFLMLGEFIRRVWLRIVLAMAGVCLLGVGVGGWIPGKYLAVADPFWILLFPLVVLMIFAARVGRIASLRPVLGYSLACGLLLFAGPAGIVIGVVSLVVLIAFGRKELKLEGGTTLLALMSFIYGVILHLLFNLVIMGDWLFSIKRLIPYFQSVGAPLFSSWRLAFVIVWALVCLSSLFVMSKLPFFIRFTWGLGISCVPIFLIRRLGAVFVGGEYLVYGAVSVSLMLAIAVLMTKKGVGLKVGLFSLIVTVMFLVSVSVLRRYSLMHEPYLNAAHPSREQITELIDEDWVGSRVLVFGARAASLYCVTEDEDPKVRDRFIGNVDFNIHVVFDHMEKEQLHLLVPPDDGRFYP